MDELCRCPQHRCCDRKSKSAWCSGGVAQDAHTRRWRCCRNRRPRSQPVRSVGASVRPLEVAMAFVAAINERSVERLSPLITEDHVFIDALDNRIEGRDKIVEAWRGYFSMVPDYEIKIEKLFEKESDVAL